MNTTSLSDRAMLATLNTHVRNARPLGAAPAPEPSLC